jgi:ABC-type transporter Mla subunit MlaD
LNRDFWTGIFVLFGLASLIGVYATLFVEEVTQNVSYYYLDAKDVTGITEGVPVQMRGYNIGSVGNIEVFTEPDLHFEVALALRPEIPIPSGSIVLLGSRLAGGGIIDVQPPEEPSFPLEVGSHLTLTPVTDVQELLETAELVLKDIQVITAKGREFVEDPDQGLELRLQALDKVIVEMEAMFKEGSKAVKRLDDTIVESQEGIYNSLASTEEATKSSAEAMKELEVVLKSFDEQLKEFENVSEVIDSYDLEGGNEMAEMIRNLNDSSESLERFMKAFEVAPIRTLRKGSDEVLEEEFGITPNENSSEKESPISSVETQEEVKESTISEESSETVKEQSSPEESNESPVEEPQPE